MSDRRTGLLAVSRSLPPRARLVQAARRADFLVRLNRASPAIQHPVRAIEGLTAMLVEELVDVAQITVTHSTRTYASLGGPGIPTRASQWLSIETAPLIEQVLASESTLELTLPTSAPERRNALTEIVQFPETLDDLCVLDIEELLTLPLSIHGRTLGTLTMARTHGARFHESSEQFLDSVAGQIAANVELLLMVADTRRLSSMLRGQLMPDTLPEHPHLDVATVLRPLEQGLDLGGDFVDLHGPSEELTLVIGDVAGKGAEAGFLARRIRNAVRTTSMLTREPSTVLANVNRVLIDEAGDLNERFATLVVGRARRHGGELLVELAGAGHPPILVLRGDGTVDKVESQGPVVGLENTSAFPAAEISLVPGDLLVAVTDGVLEARRGEEFFGIAGVESCLVPRGTARANAESVERGVEEFRVSPSRDDLAVLAIAFTGFPDAR